MPSVGFPKLYADAEISSSAEDYRNQSFCNKGPVLEGGNCKPERFSKADINELHERKMNEKKYGFLSSGWRFLS